MSGDTQFRELSKERAYWFRLGGIEFMAVKLEGFKASQVGGTLNPIDVRVSFERSRAESDDWIVVVKDKSGIVSPLNVWAVQAAKAITNASGSNVGTVSVVSSGSASLPASFTIPEKKK